jgi:hypothetical protein
VITIRITNARQLVEAKKGWLVAWVGGLLVDLQGRVEAAIAEKLRESLAAEGVEAVVECVPEGRSGDRKGDRVD